MLLLLVSLYNFSNNSVLVSETEVAELSVLLSIWVEYIQKM